MEKKTWIAVVLGVMIMALLIVCIGLLSAIFDQQQHNNQQQPATTPGPKQFKNVVLLIDASSGVDETILKNEINFMKNDFRNSILQKASAGGYTVRLAAVAMPSQPGTQPDYVDISDQGALEQVANKIRESSQSLDIGAALSPIQSQQVMMMMMMKNRIGGGGNNKNQIGQFGTFGLMIMASGQGVNFADALQKASKLKNDGTKIVTISLKSNGDDLKELASPDSSLDGQAITNGDAEKMKSLADSLSDIVDQQASVTEPPSTTTTTTTPPTTTTTPPTTTTTTPPTTTTTPPTTTTTTPYVPADTQIVFLVDASNGIKQLQMIKQTSFLQSELMDALGSVRGHVTDVLFVPYAFDTSPDNSEYVRLGDWKLLNEQLFNTRLAPITTFTAPLDQLQIGEALIEVGRYEKDQKMPTHLVIFASGKGTDYQKAITESKNLQAKTKIIVVSTVQPKETFNEIASDSNCVLNGQDILKGQNLKAVANSVAKCIYPASDFPSSIKHQKSNNNKKKSLPLPSKEANKAAKVVERPQTPTTTVKPVAEYNKTRNSTDVLLLVDVSNNVNNFTIKSQCDFIKDYLLTELRKVFKDLNVGASIIPYAYFTAAIEEKFFKLSDENDPTLQQQIQDTIIAPYTTFMEPLNEYRLNYSLKLLSDSYFIRSKTVKVVLISGDKSNSGKVDTEAMRIATELRKKVRIATVTINGPLTEYDSIASPGLNINGSAIKGADTKKLGDLATKVANGIKSDVKKRYADLHMLNMPMDMRSFGA